MNIHDSQTVFQCIAYLLSYPNKEWRVGLVDCSDLIKQIEDLQISTSLQSFMDDIATLNAEQLIETYVYIFDFGKKTNLYITDMSIGDQRERGAELIALKNIYSSAGFQVTDKELPDYLPLMLEFASIADENVVLPIFNRYQRNIQEIHNQLTNNESIYTEIFNCLFRVMRSMGIKEVS